jgi:uncharacterized protein (TIGR03118 family)
MSDAFVKIANKDLLMIASTFSRHIARLAALILGVVLSTAIFAALPGTYVVKNLVADPGGPAAVKTDANLVNGWGIALRPTSPFWVSDNGTSMSTVYDGLGNIISPPSPVSIPGPPTGIVANLSSADFGGAAFLWALEDGHVAAWSGGPAATTVFTATDGAVYKGLTIAGNGTQFLLYVADFHNGKIDVLTSSFVKTPVPGGFADPTIPAGFNPFNILNIQGNLYVAYALKATGGNDEVHGAGLGFVNVFNPDGVLLARVATRGNLNAPWGMALAPAGFGTFSNRLLVGNFGDGTINAYKLNPNTFAGQLRSSTGGILTIDGLWGIAFGNGVRNQPSTTLFFAAGPSGESHGVYGRIDAIPPQPENDDDNDEQD